MPTGTQNRVKATLIIRTDTSSNWLLRNPTLAEGEYGLETNTFLIKVGDGLRDWEHLPYLNKLDADFFKQETNGTITFSDAFMATIDALEAAAGSAIEHLTITDPPVNDTDVPNKKYVDDAIRAAGHLSREIVAELPDAADASETVIYMIQNNDHYDEYMFIAGAFDMVGQTGASGAGYDLQIATAVRLGGVKSSSDPDHIAVDPNTGVMMLNEVSTSLLYVPTGDELVLYGGHA